ncbi:hypothetical protein BD311DRAFT_756849 [Dichomitus squalens]|uniref:Uncharacterized protein n=1 Tax=Dichomitus squalens TaxID=114155 RepID=A0A4Q9MQ10_9APHY|nr:hypothetical protein BD311DRAFT_756849 [Dichomitus squalens]
MSKQPSTCDTVSQHIRIPQVILFILRSAFFFELTGKPITWDASTANYPTMDEESTKP